MTNNNTRPDNTPHTHHKRVYSVHSKVKTKPISMVPECPHASTRISGPERLLDQDQIHSSILVPVNHQRPPEECAIRRCTQQRAVIHQPELALRILAEMNHGVCQVGHQKVQSAILVPVGHAQVPAATDATDAHEGVLLQGAVSSMNINPQETSESDVFQHSTFTNLCPSQFFLEVQCCSHSTSHPFYLPEAYPVCHRH